MTMDFFAHQERARRNTKLLLFYFILAVLGMIVAIYAACVFILGAAGDVNAAMNPGFFGLVSAGTLAVVFLGSLIRIAELAKGGRVVAESLGGRLLSPQTRDYDERKLLNVVEEMAIASGIPVPPVYVMDDEQGINAFAAGFSPSDAVIGVTRGALQLLNRNELQGVIAHEFSHILHGDMRLNIRLMGWLFGIVCLTVIGRVLLRTRGRKNPLPAFGLALLLFGSIGLFFGRLIKAAVSRQREFLADASAVQFTRLPEGLAGALKKIGGLAYGSRVRHAAAEEASHLFFGNALGNSWFNLMSTHPPLEERIRRIEPNWDGTLPKVSGAAPRARAADAEGRAADRRPPQATAAAGRAGPAERTRPAGPPGRGAPEGLRVDHIMGQVGAPTIAHLASVAALTAELPKSVADATRDTFDAEALVYALLLSAEARTRTQQWQALQRIVEPPMLNTVARLADAVQTLGRRQRLPVVARALPALRRLPAAHYEGFSHAVRVLVEADRQIDLFEFALQKMLLRHLEPHFRKVPPRVAQYHTLKPLLADCAVLLSALAHAGHADAAQAQAAFRLGAQALGPEGAALAFLKFDQCNLAQIDGALNRLDQIPPPLKKQVLDACAQTVAADGRLQEKEAELLRAIADTLGCPLPPFAQGQVGSPAEPGESPAIPELRNAGKVAG